MTTRTPRQARSRDGFTLLEMLVVLALTAGLLVAAATFYLEIARASTAAAERTREGRRGTALLDRLARDLEGTVLVVKPDAVDPLAHPWVFLAEARNPSDGADRVKFQTRSHEPRTGALHESDLATVSWFLLPGEEGYDLYRGVLPRLPDGLDRTFPAAHDEGVERMASRLESFSLRFLDEEGAWAEEWDSSTLARSSQLPRAAEARLVLLPEGALDELLPETTPEPQVLERQVRLPVRPLDLEEALATEEDGEDDEEEEDSDCVTVGECIARNPDVFDLLLGASPDLALVIDSIQGQCFADHASTLNVVVEGCE